MSQETLPDFEFIRIFVLGAGKIHPGYPLQRFIGGACQLVQWTRPREA
jgi:hypothetical protein